MNRLTEAAQNVIPPQGIKGRQILKLLLNHLQTGVEDDQTFKIAELTSLKCVDSRVIPMTRPGFGVI